MAAARLLHCGGRLGGGNRSAPRFRGNFGDWPDDCVAPARIPHLVGPTRLPSHCGRIGNGSNGVHRRDGVRRDRHARTANAIPRRRRDAAVLGPSARSRWDRDRRSACARGRMDFRDHGACIQLHAPDLLRRADRRCADRRPRRGVARRILLRRHVAHDLHHRRIRARERAWNVGSRLADCPAAGAGHAQFLAAFR